MYKLQFKVSEHVLTVRTDSNRIMAFFQSPDWSRLRINHTDTDLTVYIELGYGKPFVDFNVESKCSEKGITFCRTDYKIEIDPALREADIYVFDEFALKHALMNLYSTFIVHNQWGLLVHSSCVAQHDRAFLFTGHSGAGKSTAARLSDPRPILSDEATIIKIDSGEARVFDSPFRSEIITPGLEESRKLAGIHLLEQSPRNNRKRLKKADGMLQMMDKIFYWPHHAGDTHNTFVLCRKLADAVPIYNLEFKKESSFWEEIS
ncbi:hypothetical protein [Paenibacillus montanisoli]|uniref:Uncharacterized protein n=1 Tax=Paenibacillus montanisoli TaxID=2081970 RepID=A0A328U7U8_9BACL|nr:hypothetical protein [Paenibacillus montanisoli]RAP77471.1 hypothetical protein DL346_03045 [Paenibacillus montanisoli]